MTLTKVIELVKQFLENKKVGNIQINCFKGGISSINVNETIKE